MNALGGVLDHAAANLLPCLLRLAQLQHEAVDRVALHGAAQAANAAKTHRPWDQLSAVAEYLQVSAPRWLAAPDPSETPSLIHTQHHEGSGEWGVLRGKNAVDQWISEWWDGRTQRWTERADVALPGQAVAAIRLATPHGAASSPLRRLIRQEIFARGTMVRDAAIGGLMINTVALAASFYSLQIYDRVIPTGAEQTLLVLTLGVVAAILFELLARVVRSNLYERLIDQVDQRLARTVYMRFLAIRLDQLPPSVGSLASQMRGYETVRGFFTSLTTNFLVDAPFALVFTLLIALIGGALALVPLGFLILSVGVGLYYRSRVRAIASTAMAASNLKTGLLVETVEGAETIKSGQGGWRMLGRWMKTTDEARACDLQMRNITEHSQHLIGAFQQLSYVMLVAAGALLVSRGELTMGGLIACSILSGRVLAPVAMVPSQLVQWAHTQAALRGLDKLWALQGDHDGQTQAVVLENISGHYRFESVTARYGSKLALAITSLQINAGEKVAVLGPVGAGKTTLLRLLSGLYKPQEGRILLDDVDLAHIAKPTLADRLGYVQQEGRLFAGTLRDNLLLGRLDPGDDAIMQAARQTGLLQNVISRHPDGLQQQIFEGGSGLSGGQRQLVNLTRAFLRQPRIWLLDEPTASMDRNLEEQVTAALKRALAPESTLVLVTHKAEMLELVDRLIVIANHQIVMDGPKASVLRKLQATAPESTA